MVVQLDKKVKRKYFGLGPKIEQVELPDGTTTTDFQDWEIVFGYANARRKRNKTKVKGICRDALEADSRRGDRSGEYLYEKLLATARTVLKKNMFDADYYWLQYQMPDAPFTVNVEIDNPAQVLRAYKEFAELDDKPELKKRLVRRLIPRGLLKGYGQEPVFDERPPKKVKTSLRTRPLMTQYLVGIFLEGKRGMSIDRFDGMMEDKIADFKVKVYEALPKNEKKEHEYLIEVKPKKKKNTLEEQYLCGELTLQEFADEKYPERAAKRIAREQTYPLPEQKHSCVVCARPLVATIKCMECENRVCKRCTRLVYGTANDVEAKPAFVLLHHTYCLKLGHPIKHKLGGADKGKGAGGAAAKNRASAG